MHMSSKIYYSESTELVDVSSESEDVDASASISTSTSIGFEEEVVDVFEFTGILAGISVGVTTIGLSATCSEKTKKPPSISKRTIKTTGITYPCFVFIILTLITNHLIVPYPQFRSKLDHIIKTRNIILGTFKEPQNT